MSEINEKMISQVNINGEFYDIAQKRIINSEESLLVGERTEEDKDYSVEIVGPGEDDNSVVLDGGGLEIKTPALKVVSGPVSQEMNDGLAKELVRTMEIDENNDPKAECSVNMLRGNVSTGLGVYQSVISGYTNVPGLILRSQSTPMSKIQQENGSSSWKSDPIHTTASLIEILNDKDGNSVINIAAKKINILGEITQYNFDGTVPELPGNTSGSGDNTNEPGSGLKPNFGGTTLTIGSVIDALPFGGVTATDHYWLGYKDTANTDRLTILEYGRKSTDSTDPTAPKRSQAKFVTDDIIFDAHDEDIYLLNNASMSGVDYISLKDYVSKSVSNSTQECISEKYIKHIAGISDPKTTPDGATYRKYFGIGPTYTGDNGLNNEWSIIKAVTLDSSGNKSKASDPFDKLYLGARNGMYAESGTPTVNHIIIGAASPTPTSQIDTDGNITTTIPEPTDTFLASDTVHTGSNTTVILSNASKVSIDSSKTIVDGLSNLGVYVESLSNKIVGDALDNYKSSTELFFTGGSTKKFIPSLVPSGVDVVSEIGEIHYGRLISNEHSSLLSGWYKRSTQDNGNWTYAYLGGPSSPSYFEVLNEGNNDVVVNEINTNTRGISLLSHRPDTLDISAGKILNVDVRGVNELGGIYGEINLNRNGGAWNSLPDDDSLFTRTVLGGQICLVDTNGAILPINQWLKDNTCIERHLDLYGNLITTLGTTTPKYDALEVQSRHITLGGDPNDSNSNIQVNSPLYAIENPVYIKELHLGTDSSVVVKNSFIEVVEGLEGKITQNIKLGKAIAVEAISIDSSAKKVDDRTSYNSILVGKNSTNTTVKSDYNTTIMSDDTVEIKAPKVKLPQNVLIGTKDIQGWLNTIQVQSNTNSGGTIGTGETTGGGLSFNAIKANDDKNAIMLGCYDVPSANIPTIPGKDKSLFTEDITGIGDVDTDDITHITKYYKSALTAQGLENVDRVNLGFGWKTINIGGPTGSSPLFKPLTASEKLNLYGGNISICAEDPYNDSTVTSWGDISINASQSISLSAPKLTLPNESAIYIGQQTLDDYIASKTSGSSSSTTGSDSTVYAVNVNLGSKIAQIANTGSGVDIVELGRNNLNDTTYNYLRGNTEIDGKLLIGNGSQLSLGDPSKLQVQYTISTEPGHEQSTYGGLGEYVNHLITARLSPYQDILSGAGSTPTVGTSDVQIISKDATLVYPSIEYIDSKVSAHNITIGTITPTKTTETRKATILGTLYNFTKDMVDGSPAAGKTYDDLVDSNKINLTSQAIWFNKYVTVEEFKPQVRTITQGSTLPTPKFTKLGTDITMTGNLTMSSNSIISVDSADKLQINGLGLDSYVTNQVSASVGSIVNSQVNSQVPTAVNNALRGTSVIIAPSTLKLGTASGMLIVQSEKSILTSPVIHLGTIDNTTNQKIAVHMGTIAPYVVDLAKLINCLVNGSQPTWSDIEFKG